MTHGTSRAALWVQERIGILAKDPHHKAIDMAVIPVGRLGRDGVRFERKLAPKALESLAQELGLLGLRKLRFSGEIRPEGRKDWLLSAELGATVVQACIRSLEPVTSRVEDRSERLYTTNDLGQAATGEVEMPEDDRCEALGDEIDIDQVLLETLSLALPLYPMAEGSEELAQHDAAPQDAAPFSEEKTKPFAGLASLKSAMSGPKDDPETDA